MNTDISDRTAALIARHPLVDVHSDYAIEIYRAQERGDRSAFTDEHLPALRRGGVCMEVFTAGGDFDIDGLRVWEDRVVRGIIESTRKQIAEHPECFLILDADGLQRAESRDGFGFMLALEGIRCIEDTAALHLYHTAGIRAIILTHNERNLAADGCGEPKPGGLSKLGRQIVGAAEELHMVLDLVHLSDPSFFDALENYSAPPMVSHSNARAICDHRRNLTDEQIRMIAERNGVIGLNFLGMFIDPDMSRATPDRLVDHALHIAGIAGSGCLALGPDYADYYMDAMLRWLQRDNLPMDLMTFIAGADDVAHLPVFIDALLSRGFSDDDVAGIMGGNALRLYRTIFTR